MTEQKKNSLVSGGSETIKEEFILRNENQVAQSAGIGNAEVEARIWDPVSVNELLERFRTKVYKFEKPEDEFEEGAKSVVLEAGETLAFETAMPLTRGILADRRFKSITLLTDNVAQNRFLEEPEFGEFKEINNESVFEEIGEASPFDVAIACVDTYNSPESALLFGAKSVFGAQKLFYIFTGWQTELAGHFKQRADLMDKIDAIFCNNELAKKILVSGFPKSVQHPNIYDFGTPYSDTVLRDKARELSKTGREKLGIDGDSLGILYIGDKSFAYEEEGFSGRINEISFEETLKAVIKLAHENPGRNYSFLVRPHPGDTNKQELFAIAQRSEKPENLSVVDASREIVSMAEAGYACDVLVSIVGTELFMSPLRGRSSVFLGLPGKGMGKDVHNRTYSDEIWKIIKADQNIAVVSSAEELKEFLNTRERIVDPEVSSSAVETAAEKILRMALE